MDEEYRREFRVALPATGVDVPTEYTVRLFGGKIGTQLLSIVTRVRGGRVSGEMLTKQGVFRGEIPPGEMDLFARQAIYMFRSQEVPLGQWYHPPPGALSGPHTPDYTIEIEAEEESVLLLASGPAFAEINVISVASGGLKPFAHAWTCSRLIWIAQKHFRVVEASPQLTQAIFQRLSSFQPDDRPLDDFRRMDRKAIEAQLYAHLLFDWEVAEAIPVFGKLRLREYEKRLRICLAEDPVPDLKAALTSGDWAYATWALDYMNESVEPEERREIMVCALRTVKNEYLLEFLLDDLASLPADAASTTTIGEMFADAPPHSVSKVAAARCLLFLTQDDGHYDYLRAVALETAANTSDLPEWRRRAVEAVAAFSERLGRRRDETAGVLAALLGRIPLEAEVTASGMDILVDLLGRVGGAKDAELVGRYTEHDSDYMAHAAIFALASLDPNRAVEEARKRLRLFVESGGERHSYRWNVLEFLGLFCALEARSAVQEIEEVFNVLRKQSSTLADQEIPRIKALLGQLRAGRLSERARYAVAFAKLQPRPGARLLGILQQRLVDAGVDGELIEALQARPRNERRSTFEW